MTFTVLVIFKYHRETREQRRSLVPEIAVADVYDLGAGRRFSLAGRERAAAVLVQRPTLRELEQVRFQVAVRGQHVVAGLVVQRAQQPRRLAEIPSCVHGTQGIQNDSTQPSSDEIIRLGGGSSRPRESECGFCRGLIPFLVINPSAFKRGIHGRNGHHTTKKRKYQTFFFFITLILHVGAKEKN